MTDQELEKAAEEWVSKFANQLPGSFDHAEGVKCYLAGAKSRDDAFARLIKDKASNDSDYLELSVAYSKQADEVRELRDRNERQIKLAHNAVDEIDRLESQVKELRDALGAYADGHDGEFLARAALEKTERATDSQSVRQRSEK